MHVVLLVAAIACAALAGCGEDDEEPAAPSPSLDGTPWVLASGLDVPGWEAVAPSATFADGKVGGSTGCNRYGGAYTVDGDALEIADPAVTRKACGPPADAVEPAYLDALQQVAAWRLEDAELVLLDAEDAELLRFRGATVTGSWKLTGFLDGNGVTSPLAGTEITADFAEDGKVSGSSGCNTYGGTFTTDGGSIALRDIAMTEMACEKPAGVMEQEQAYLAALPLAVSYSVDGAMLSLLTAEGTFVATYERAG